MGGCSTGGGGHGWVYEREWRCWLRVETFDDSMGEGVNVVDLNR